MRGEQAPAAASESQGAWGTPMVEPTFRHALDLSREFPFDQSSNVRETPARGADPSISCGYRAQAYRPSLIFEKVDGQFPMFPARPAIAPSMVDRRKGLHSIITPS